MKGKRWLWWLSAVLAVLVLATVAAGCGSDDDEEDEATPAETGAATDTGPAAEAITVGLVTDIGGLNDRGFNELANSGIERAVDELGVDSRVLESGSDADYIPNLSQLAEEGYNLVVSNGFLMGEATQAAAEEFPDTNFAIIDFAYETPPPNLLGLVFKEQEVGYLAGYLAGKMSESGTVSTVGGQKIPPVDRFIAGFQAGAKAANPDIQTLNGYSQDFVDQAKCKEVALDQIAQGSKVVFQVAGQCGLGALDAAKEKGVQGIGVDADQAYLGDHILTSALKKVDVAVFDAIKRAQDGATKGGSDVIASVENGGVGLGKLGPEGEKYADQIKEIQDQIASGEIADIPDTVK